MPIRPLTPLESNVAAQVLKLGTQNVWEYSASINASKQTLIEIRTDKRADGADPSQEVHRIAKGGDRVVLHHNHLSQESLSSADWNGLVEIFNETFAHCADGTKYWGRVLNSAAVKHVVENNYGRLESDSQNFLFNELNSMWIAAASPISTVFRKEVVNRAMRKKGLVEYDVEWGDQDIWPSGPARQTAFGPVGLLGAQWDGAIDKSAARLAQTM